MSVRIGTFDELPKLIQPGHMVLDGGGAGGSGGGAVRAVKSSRVGSRGARTEVLYKGLDCRRCFHPTCTRGEENCMKQITVEEVWHAAERLLA